MSIFTRSLFFSLDGASKSASIFFLHFFCALKRQILFIKVIYLGIKIVTVVEEENNNSMF